MSLAIRRRPERLFLRLELQDVRKSDDESILAWQGHSALLSLWPERLCCLGRSSVVRTPNPSTTCSVKERSWKDACIPWIGLFGAVAPIADASAELLERVMGISCLRLRFGCGSLAFSRQRADGAELWLSGRWEVSLITISVLISHVTRSHGLPGM